ncbi:MAG: PetM family cytochrome b6-f complex subunit 7 [Pseudanabaenaceae cyanobacterium]
MEFTFRETEIMGEFANAAVLSMVLVMVGIGLGYLLLRLQGE